MPKLFPIDIEVEELFVGKIMRQLHAMDGVAKVNLRMDEKKKPNGEMPKTRGPYKPRKTFATTGEEEIAKLLNKDSMARTVIADHFKDMGRSPASINSILFDMKKKGEAKLTEDGTAWMLTKKMRDRMRHHSSKKK